MHPQLTLALDTGAGARFDNYFSGPSNQLALNSVQQLATGELAEPQIFLWGDLGCGKSHLLSAACALVSDRGYRVAYVPGELANHSGSLEGLEQVDLLCIDDLQRLDHAAEVDLFHCINRCRVADTRLLLTADRAPDALGVRLPDLTTRLAWGPVYQLATLPEEELADALRHQFASRSLAVSDDVPGYLIRRYPRNISALKRVLDELDAASLTEQRRVTIPLIKSVLPVPSV